MVGCFWQEPIPDDDWENIPPMYIDLSSNLLIDYLPRYTIAMGYAFKKYTVEMECTLHPQIPLNIDWWTNTRCQQLSICYTIWLNLQDSNRVLGFWHLSILVVTYKYLHSNKSPTNNWWWETHKWLSTYKDLGLNSAIRIFTQIWLVLVLWVSLMSWWG